MVAQFRPVDFRIDEDNVTLEVLPLRTQGIVLTFLQFAEDGVKVSVARTDVLVRDGQAFVAIMFCFEKVKMNAGTSFVDIQLLRCQQVFLCGPGCGLLYFTLVGVDQLRLDTLVDFGYTCDLPCALLVCLNLRSKRRSSDLDISCQRKQRFII